MGTPVVKHGREGGLNKMFCGEREEREREKDGRCCAIQEQDKEMMLGLFSSQPGNYLALGTDDEGEGPDV